MSSQRPSELRRISVTSYIRDRLIRETAERGQASELARKLGFDKATISDIKSGKKGAGEDLASAFAGLWGMNYAALCETAAAWYSEHAPTNGSQRRDADVYPERAKAIDSARVLGYAEYAIDHVASETDVVDASAKPARWWIERIQSTERAMEGTAAANPKTGRIAPILVTRLGPESTKQRVTKKTTSEPKK